MNTKLLIVAGLLAVLFFASGCIGQSQTQQQQKTTEIVTIQNFAFNPATLTIKAGTTVIWENKDSTTHDVTNDAKGTVAEGQLFDIDMEPGQSGNHTFAEAGEYPYHCNIHPSMTGKIVVE